MLIHNCGSATETSAGRTTPEWRKTILSSGSQCVRMWSDAELGAYVTSRGRSVRSASTAVPSVDHTVVLGSAISIDAPTQAPLLARKRAAWHAFFRSKHGFVNAAYPSGRECDSLIPLFCHDSCGGLSLSTFSTLR